MVNLFIHCLLDLSKAFDRVSHTKLWNVLDQVQVQDNVINILRLWYGQQQISVRWGNHISEAFYLRSGVGQGGVIEPGFSTSIWNV